MNIIKNSCAALALILGLLPNAVHCKVEVLSPVRVNDAIKNARVEHDSAFDNVETEVSAQFKRYLVEALDKKGIGTRSELMAPTIRYNFVNLITDEKVAGKYFGKNYLNKVVIDVTVRGADDDKLGKFVELGRARFSSEKLRWDVMRDLMGSEFNKTLKDVAEEVAKYVANFKVVEPAK